MLFAKKLINKGYIIIVVNDNTSVVYNAFKSPSFPVSDREFVFVRHVIEDFDGNGGYLLLINSINYKDQPTLKKRVR